MKTKNVYLALILLSFISWSCSTQDDLSQKTLKTSINSSVQELTTAMNVISSTDGYKVLGISNTESSASKVSGSWDFVIDSTMNSIVLADIAGVYDYKANYYKRGPQSVLRFFTKTADSSIMVVRLPEEKVKRPGSLTRFMPTDSLLANNYVIALSDYQYKFNRYLGWDYKMASNINIRDTNVGDLKIQSSNSKENGYKYASEFVFADNYKAICNYVSGDTAIAIYSISDGTKTLYEEKYTAIKNFQEKRHREREYSLTIGDVQIVRKPNFGKNTLDSAKVYVAGVLQVNAKVEIIDVEVADETDNSIVNYKRDIQITFDDGTVTTISQLLGNSVDTIRTLFASLRQASFATSVIDWIAWDIYKNKE